MNRTVAARAVSMALLALGPGQVGCTIYDGTVPAPVADDPARDGGALVEGPDVRLADGAGPGLRVFVSSLGYPGDLRRAGHGESGLAGGDNLCNTLAQAAGLSGTFRAWLSDASASAVDRITSQGPWYDMAGRLVFANRANLMTVPRVQLQHDEFGRRFEFAPTVWTGTGLGGYARSPDCGGWTQTDAGMTGRVGLVVLGDDQSRWSDYATNYCNHDQHLYCFEQ